MDGFVSLQLLKSAGGQWVEMIYWRNMADTERAAKTFEKLPSGQAMVGIVDLNSLTVLFGEPKLVHAPSVAGHG